MQRILIVIIVNILLLFLAAFIIFAAFRYLTKEDRLEKILFFAMAFLTIAMAIIASIGILTC